MKNVFTGMAVVCLSALSLSAQVCDPSTAPTGLNSTYTPGTGVLLEWDAVPGSVGALILTLNPAGLNEVKRIESFEPGRFLVPEVYLSPGTYTWRVLAVCSTLPPFGVTPVSTKNSFTVGGGSSCPDTVTDIDGNVYATIQIGSQCWTAENLKVERYRNGDSIPTDLSSSAWSSTTSGAIAVYNNVAANKATYGLLYNWFAAVDPRGLCPTGWHVPTDAEWIQLTDHLRGSSVAGGAMKTTGTLEAGTGLWFAPNSSASNRSGFSGLPGGFRLLDGSFDSQGSYGYWWSSSEYSTIFAWFRRLNYDNATANRGLYNKQLGFSVRCLRD